jgi:hypothetical protein
LEGGRQSIDRAAKHLGFGPADYITRTYPALFAEYASHKPAGEGQSEALSALGGRDMLFSTAKMMPK